MINWKRPVLPFFPGLSRGRHHTGTPIYIKTGAAYLILLMAIAAGCENDAAPPPDPDPGSCMFLGADTCRQPAEEPLLITIALDDEKQVIHSFGGSDCWTAKFFGKWENEAKKNKVADLLFSTDTFPDGTPMGIGLSLWRFNIGAGSFEQGDASGIATDWRREECFLNEDGTYNWEKQMGQQWFLEAAKQRGVAYSLGFSLSPPVHMTRNGKAYNGSGGTKMNIQEGRMDDYADFLATVSAHFRFDYLSPVNEPQWEWGSDQGASQEGTQAENQEIATLTRLLSQELARQSPFTEVTIAEAGSWSFLYGDNYDGRGDQINQFFSSASPHYVGDLPHVAPVISGHSYWTTCPDDHLVDVRRKVSGRIGQVDASLQLWQSEFGILGDICGQYSGFPRNTSIDYGLYVAKVLHHDLTIANVSSWSWWLSVSPYNYSDALVYINAPGNIIQVDQTKKDGIVLESKQLWAYGNYSRFIRPGMIRIGASVEGIESAMDAADDLLVSAYKDETTKKLVVVVVNMGMSKRLLAFNQDSPLFRLSGDTVRVYTTDSNDNLKKSVAATDNIVAGPRSITSLTVSYE